MLIAVAGLYFSYHDFRNTLSHKLLGEGFHLGVYLFWLGWIGISIGLLFTAKLAAQDYNSNLHLYQQTKDKNY